MVKVKKEEAAVSAEEQALALESKRLRELAISRGLLARTKANPPASLLPTKTIRKCNGKDIVKKGNRKTKYLFAFPGFVAPVAGGKFGELTHLDSRNPILYIDFPQGRLKLFGTIVYPRNKYLTMHFLPGRGDIVCEDCFESLVVFPESWWIGTKDENPEELRLPFPTDLQQVKHKEFDFNAGAGRVDEAPAARTIKATALNNDPDSPMTQFPVDVLEEPGSPVDVVNDKPVSVRQSARNSGKKTSYHFALSSSSNSEGGDDDASDSSEFLRSARSRGKKKTSVMKEHVALFESTDKEQQPSSKPSNTVLKQGTLTSFLTKTEVVQITDSPDLSQKRALGQRKAAQKGTKRRRQSITEISSDSDDMEFLKTPSDGSD